MCKLFTAALHTLILSANRKAPLFIIQLGCSTKIFFFFWLVVFKDPPSPAARAQMPLWLSAHYVQSAGVWGSALVQYV